MIPTLAVLISGKGSNLQAIIKACKEGELHAKINIVISNKVDAYGLVLAEEANIPTFVISKEDYPKRSAYDAALANKLKEIKPDWIVLAGWMRILTHHFLSLFPNKVINLHPALPGMFPGTNAIERAFQAFQEGKINNTGVMVHLVPDEGVDCGPILSQMSVPIEQNDTLETLADRVHQTEHQLLVQTLKTLILL